MSRFTIIEDCSPYYIRFTHDNIGSIIEHCLDICNKTSFKAPYMHYKMPLSENKFVLDNSPVFDILPLIPTRISMFASQGGYYYQAHKDGLDMRFGINYTIKILDDKCVTSWYSDNECSNYPIGNIGAGGGSSRELTGFIKENHTALKRMTAVAGECILFNTDIYHDFDNSQSTNERVVLTLRPSINTMYFDDARVLLFK